MKKQHLTKLLLVVLLIPCLVLFGTSWTFATTSELLQLTTEGQLAAEDDKITDGKTVKDEEDDGTEPVEPEDKANNEDDGTEPVEPEDIANNVDAGTGLVEENVNLMMMDTSSLSLIEPKIGFSVSPDISGTMAIGDSYKITVSVSNEGDWHRRKLENATLKLYIEGETNAFHEEDLGTIVVYAKQSPRTHTFDITGLKAIKPSSGNKVQVKAELVGDLYYTLLGVKWNKLENNHKVIDTYNYNVKICNDYTENFQELKKALNAKVDGGTVTFTIPQDACPIELSFSSYIYPPDTVPAKNGRPYLPQELYSNVTDTYGPGVHTVVIDMPECGPWQTDLYLGPKIEILGKNGHPSDKIIAWDVNQKSCQPDIQIEKKVEPGFALPGQEVTYKFTITNIGKTNLKNIVVRDILFGEDWKYEIASLEIGGKEEFEIPYIISKKTLGELKNTANVSGEYIYKEYTDETNYVEKTVVVTKENDATVIVREVKKLRLTSMCSIDPEITRRWRVRNSNDFDIMFTYVLVGTPQMGTKAIDANGELFFETDTVPNSNNTLKILVYGVQHDVKASGGKKCEETPGGGGETPGGGGETPGGGGETPGGGGETPGGGSETPGGGGETPGGGGETPGGGGETPGGGGETPGGGGETPGGGGETPGGGSETSGGDDDTDETGTLAPAPTALTVIEDELIPLAPTTVEIPTVPETEMTEETEESALGNDTVLADLEDEETPLSPTALPKTGEIPQTLFYGIGTILTAIGARLRRKY